MISFALIEPLFLQLQFNYKNSKESLNIPDAFFSDMQEYPLLYRINIKYYDLYALL